MAATKSALSAGAIGACAALSIAIVPARGETLADAMVTAYLNSPEVASQRATIKTFSELAVQERSGNRPTVSGTASFTSELDDFDQVEFPTTLSLNLTQALYTGGQVENAIEAAETRLTSQDVLLLATEQAVLLDTITAYSDVLRDMEFVDLGVNNVRVLSEQLRAARERFEVGEVTRTDVEQARASVAAARSSLAANRGALKVSQESYFRVVGERPGDLAPVPPLPDLPASREEAVQLALRNDPSLIAARLEREATGSDVRSAIGALLPQVSLLGELSRTDTVRGDFGADTDLSVGVSVTFPFYTGGFNFSNVREAQASVEGAQADITAAERDAAQDVGIAWADLEVARASIEAGILEVQAAQLAFDGVQEEAKVGARTTLDVLDAEEDVLEARADLVEARRDEYVASYTVLETIGMLTIDHLGLDIGDVSTTVEYYEGVKNRNFGYDPTDDTVWSLSWRP
ncbi:MAG: TolC family outer membrane protein [Pseudomonadota bacterium]